ncbi:efflux RND transporter periplasmic adaptor subunit [Legionella worsleiensis]|uniref:Efflux protein n=1 Tax=Legionella worsleiensis TaxID=45076 RepID=A0A0W1ALD3_9GAMM|nr:efflux RND transporter periplasmic adaptor subunit [Legionella worsleiensis]KTD82098.1 efflux protein [Legionella worsleiensis]STY31470.1 efflux protein [Legionella worsleiensis]
MLNVSLIKNLWQSKHHRNITLLALVITSLLFFIGKWLFNANKLPQLPPNKVVEVETVTTQTLNQTIRLLGTVHPKHTTTLFAKGSGMLDEVVPTGQRIKKGALIAKIDNPDLEKNLHLSVSAATLAKTQLERYAPLIPKGIVSPREVEEKKQAWLNAQKELSRAKIERDNLRFYAPFDGVIGAYKKREGAEVTTGEAVVSIYDPGSLVVDFDIPCTNLSDINEGQTVRILGKKYPLSHIQKMIDETTHMCPADVDIRCDKCLLGATVEVELIIAQKHNTLVVPKNALFLRNSQPFVYIVKNNKVVLVPIKTGLEQENSIEVTEGLEKGQQLVIKGQDRLYPDMTVDIYTPPTKNQLG